MWRGRGCGPLTESSSHKNRVMAQRLFFLNMRGSSTGPSLQQSQEQAIHTIWHAFYSSIGQYDYSANAAFSFGRLSVGFQSGDASVFSEGQQCRDTVEGYTNVKCGTLQTMFSLSEGLKVHILTWSMRVYLQIFEMIYKWTDSPYGKKIYFIIIILLYFITFIWEYVFAIYEHNSR